MLKGDANNVTLGIIIEYRIVVQIVRVNDLRIPQLKV